MRAITGTRRRWPATSGTLRACGPSPAAGGVLTATLPSTTVTTVAAGTSAGTRAATAASGGPMIQLGAFSSEAAAAKAWTNLSKRFPYLAELGKSVAPTTAGEKTIYRLRAGAGSAANAASLCAKLRVAGENCVVVR